MHRLLPVLALLAGPAMAANYATCILDKAPGTQNDVAAGAVHEVCIAANPGGMDAVSQGSGRGLMAYKSGPECLEAKARDTRSARAAQLMSAACRRLYDEDGPWNRYK